MLAFVLATANLIVFNVQTGGGTLRGGQAVLADYTGQDEGVDAGNYGENVGRLTLATSWVLSGAIEKRRFVGETLAQPLLLGYLGAGRRQRRSGRRGAGAGCRCWCRCRICWRCRCSRASTSRS